MDFNTFEYDKNLSQDKNISKLSDFFVNKKPIFFVEKKENNYNEEIEGKKSDNKINEENNNENENNNKNENGEEDDEIKSSHYYNDTDDINVYNNYIQSNNIFPFYDNQNENLISYYIKFKKSFSSKKFEIFKRKNNCDFILKLKNRKFVFYLNKWICIFNLKSEKYNYKKILELEFAETISYYPSGILELPGSMKKEDLEEKILIYKTKKDSWDSSSFYNHAIDLLYAIDLNESNKFIMHKIFLPWNKFVVEGVHISKNKKYKNIIFLCLSVPLLTLSLLDCKLNQINTIIEVINPICKRIDIFFKFLPCIVEIKELNNNKILLIGSQHHYYDYPPFINGYYNRFEIIFDLDKNEIENAKSINEEENDLRSIMFY